ncbi:Gfo/Idh/MocA family oxidoreductase [Frondihabitans peucedani]|uniref:Gfo/Idh/MocA family oxidoreductase n=1 Tax=Frondihabitans peucedani TaxID=598626 RepID=A0ABP8E4Y1_9MICO
MTRPPLVDAAAPVRIVLVGAGLMGRAWLGALDRSQDAEVVGIVDLDQDLARAAADEAGLPGLVVGTSVTSVAEATGAHAIVNVTVPAAHLPIADEALSAGLSVLSEKPLAPTVAAALLSAAAADRAGRLLMTSQNRRYYDSLTAYRAALGEIGEIALLTTEYTREAHFPGFRETMAHPLLVDMAIHAFDVARHLLGTDPVSVTCDTSNPPWSWFEGDSVANALFEFEGGARYRYTGTWTTRGLETSWNGAWRASGSHGSATWDGETALALERVDPATGESTGLESPPLRTTSPEEIDGSLADFVDALRTGRTPDTEAHRNILSLAMVEAAVRSADTGRRIEVADVLEDAYATALTTDAPQHLREALASWGSVSAGLHLHQTVDA